MRQYNCKLYASVPFAICALLTSVVSAQQTLGAINGAVTDGSGAAVTGAHVTITSTGTNLTFTADSRPNGEYAFQNLPVGTYSVQVV
jgi:hypothetical protein